MKLWKIYEDSVLCECRGHKQNICRTYLPFGTIYNHMNAELIVLNRVWVSFVHGICYMAITKRAKTDFTHVHVYVKHFTFYTSLGFSSNYGENNHFPCTCNNTDYNTKYFRLFSHVSKSKESINKYLIIYMYIYEILYDRSIGRCS